MQLIACRKLLPSKEVCKKLLMMKLSTFFLLVVFVNVSAHGVGQHVNINVKEESLIKVIKELKRQTGFTFAYSKLVMQKAQPVTVNISNAVLEQALNQLLKNQPLTYTIVDNTVVISLKKEQSPQPQPPPVAAAPVPAPEMVITGKIANDRGEALAGATVAEKGAEKNIVTSREDGSFSITVADANATLIISFVGYATKEVKATSAQMNIVLSPAASQEVDIVVIGYGTSRNKDLTGSVSAVGNKDFNAGSVLSPQQAIQGKVSGVNISQNSGKPGGSNTVRIRGGTSLTGSNDPLYVIDGIPISNSAGVAQANIRGNGTDFFDQEPTNPLMTLNPDDIESITVLKDASATAIYGSRGANGVIVITTKKGSSGKGKVTLGTSVGISKVEGTLDVLSADQYRKAAKDLGITIDDKGANTDWQDEIYRTGVSQDHHLSLSGGGDKTTYRASFGYGDQQGIMLTSDLKRANARININHSMLNDRLTFDLRLNYGQTFSKQAPVSNTVGSEFGSSMNYEALVFNPTYPIYDSAGNYNFVRPYRVNPVSFKDQILDQVTNNRFISSLSTTFKITKPLSVNVNLGYTNQNINRNSYVSKANLLGEGLRGYASVQKLEDYSRLIETIVRYQQRFGKHSLEALAGYSWQYFVNTGNRTTAQGFLSDEFKWYSLQAASTISLVNTFQASNTLISFYGRANYNFDDRILMTATVRRDGSSRFGSGNKWGVFPSGSIAWRLSREKFLEDVKAISDLKVRVSYGITGNQEIGNLNSITTLGATSQGYIVGDQRITTVLPQQYANPNLKWEQTSQFDAGVDFSLFDGRLRGTVDYYIKKTTDLLLRIPVPSPTAVSTQLANVGSVENKGIEISLTGTAVDHNDFKWEPGFNISFNRNKVLSLANDTYKGNNIQIGPLQGTVSLGKYAQLIVPGQPLGTFWGPRYTGVKDSLETYAPGNDTIIGSAQPKFIFGFTNTFSYKRFTLNFLFRGSVGNDVFNLTAANMAYLNNLPGKNVLTSALTSGLKRSQPKNYSSRWIEDGSFVRLDNLTLSYDMPMKKTFISSARLYVTATNLFFISSYSGIDPEVNAEVSGVGTAPLGIDYLSYPRARNVSIGANFSF